MPQVRAFKTQKGKNTPDSQVGKPYYVHPIKNETIYCMELGVFKLEAILKSALYSNREEVDDHQASQSLDKDGLKPDTANTN